jgi:hypothetical protein
MHIVSGVRKKYIWLNHYYLVSRLEVEIAIAKFKKYESPGRD